jgi:predicted acylesterase/phospholipase RssA
MAEKKGKAAPARSGQNVLVLQGGGALGAYQAGVYQALHEAEIEIDWVIGTSIGAITAALIAGNEPEHRLTGLPNSGIGLSIRCRSMRCHRWRAGCRRLGR